MPKKNHMVQKFPSFSNTTNLLSRKKENDLSEHTQSERTGEREREMP